MCQIPLTNIIKENINLNFRLRKVNQIRNYFLEEIKPWTLNYIKHLIDFACAVIACVLISAFYSLYGIPIGIASSD